MPELKPCEFCGHEHSQFSYFYFSVSRACMKCGNQTKAICFEFPQDPTQEEAEQEAIELWNRREG